MPRKPFDDSTGKHTTKEHTLPLEDVMRPVDWLLVDCSVCQAKPYEPCKSIMGVHAEKKYPHPARVEAARGRA
jgi:hypothetical protein